MKIAVYAGHGGKDKGVVSGKRFEKNLSLDVMLRISKILRSEGHTIINNRTIDNNRDVTRDVNLANRENVDAVVEIHFNASKNMTHGTEAFYEIRGGASKVLASAIVSNIAAIGFKNLGVKAERKANDDSFRMMCQTNAPATIVNCAFIDSENDMSIFNASRMAQAIARGVITAMGIGNANSEQISASLKIPAAGGLTINRGIWNVYSAAGQVVSEVYGGQRFSYSRVNNKWYYLPVLRGWINESGVSEVSVAVDNYQL